MVYKWSKMKKITSTNFNSLILTMLFSLFYGEGTFALIKRSGVDSYISILISIIITIPIIVVTVISSVENIPKIRHKRNASAPEELQIGEEIESSI